MRSYLSEWREALTIQLGRTEGSADSYISRVKQFIGWLEDNDRSTEPLDVVRADIDDFMKALFYEYKNLSNNTRAGKLSAIRSFFLHLTYKGIPNNDPTEGIPSPKVYANAPKKFSTADLRNIFNAPDLTTVQGVRDAAILKTIYGAGLRVSELIRINLEDITDTGGYIRLLIHGKGSKQRILTLRRRPSGALRAWLVHRIAIITPTEPAAFISLKGKHKHARLGSHTIGNLLKKYATRVGIASSEAFVHKLRATWASDLYDAGVEVMEIAALAGWSSIETAKRYIAISEKVLKKTAIPDRRWREFDKADGVTDE